MTSKRQVYKINDYFRQLFAVKPVNVFDIFCCIIASNLFVPLEAVLKKN